MFYFYVRFDIIPHTKPNMPIEPKRDLDDKDPTLHRLEGTRPDFKGGLVVKKETIKREPDSERSGAEDEKTPLRQSLFGLDRLAEVKRREKLEQDERRLRRELKHDERKYRQRHDTPVTAGVSDSIRENIARYVRST